jgi:hypothetical protein
MLHFCYFDILKIPIELIYYDLSLFELIFGLMIFIDEIVDDILIFGDEVKVDLFVLVTLNF